VCCDVSLLQAQQEQDQPDTSLYDTAAQELADDPSVCVAASRDDLITLACSTVSDLDN
jgi:hypothetical protein